jgi:hypothetical protein
VRRKFNYNGNENVCSISVRYGYEAADPELFLDVQQLENVRKGRVVESKQSSCSMEGKIGTRGKESVI